MTPGQFIYKPRSMPLHIHITHHLDPESRDRLLRIEQALGTIQRNQETTMANIADLKAAVQRNTDAEKSAVTLLQGISQQLKDAKAANDPAAIDAVISQLDGATNDLAAAVVANTPAA